eukprot:TRINITY_DN7047_c0_g1_i1.p1 TRINITY_DN7047_c0_g1~~TRINITY_DN7047_c0_g1_i1.p1  ORF type:complete len:377 (+),score=106.70 TRINITY_DN7047_c0_g1_i1:63-1193(+)
MNFIRRSQLKMLNSENTKKIVFVLGNQSADPDSMICSICYSNYLRTHMVDDNEKVVSLFNIPRSQFSLRPTQQAIFNRFNIDVSDCCFLDDVDFQSLDVPYGIVLVDHNVLAPHQNWMSSYLEGIIDHHRDEGHFDSIPKNIGWIANENREVGSCSTMVAECFEASDSEISADIAGMLLSVIMLDTLGLDRSKGKTTNRDEDMFEWLKEKCDVDSPSDWLQELYNTKFEPSFWEGLSTEQLIDIDHKRFHLNWISEEQPVVIGSSAILCPLKFLDWEKMIPESLEWMIENNVELQFFLSVDKTGERQLGYLTNGERAGVIEGLVHEKIVKEGLLELEPIVIHEEEETNTQRFSLFHQNNRKASRKQVVVLMQEMAI